MQYTQLTKKGFVLSIVLWIIAALLLGIAFIMLYAKEAQSLSKGVHDKLEAQLVAEDVLESLKFYILTADYDNVSFINESLLDHKYAFPGRLLVDNRVYKISENISFRIQDTSGIINVFNIDLPNVIPILLKNSIEKQQEHVIRDSLTDWIDKDGVVSLNGAEDSEYKLIQQKDYGTRNSNAIQNINEVRLINGINYLSEAKWNSLKKNLYYGKRNMTNLALVDSEHLAYRLNISSLEAESLISLRDEGMNKFIQSLYKLESFNYETMGFSLSKQLKIEISVEKGIAKSIINTIIDFSPSSNRLYTVISYESL